MTRAITICLFALGMSGLSQAKPSILHCTLNKMATVEKQLQRKGRILASRGIAATKVVFAALDTAQPRLKRNDKEVNLAILRSNETTLWALELPPKRGINIWTIFFKEKVASLSRQSHLTGNPYAEVQLGDCQ